MKYIVIVGDGMSDRPLKELNGKTPLEVACKPNMDYIAANGNSGLLRTIFKDLPADSGVANLSVLGYDPHKYYPGRGALEAMNMNIKLGVNDVALRCNTVTVKDGLLADYSAGHITSGESEKLIEYANKKLGNKFVSFHPGVAYRHVLVLKSKYSQDVECQPPHNIVGQKVDKNLVKPLSRKAKETAVLLNDIMLKSREILEEHAVNAKRVKAGKNPANMLWPWGPGKKPQMPSFKKMFGVEGSIISAVDIIKGIGRVMGLEVINVPGATGYLDTNYEGKADAALKSLEKKDFVFIHIESTDESGHEGNIEHKIRAIEDIDTRVIGRILSNISGDYTIGILPDHATPISVRMHTDDSVPFAIYSTREKKKDSVKVYSEKEAKKGCYGLKDGAEFMKILTKR
ncbi:MAG: cofactor-independent phosphoglycerate mutase [Candidatus Altiarchaeales archaeon]|nr:cofactor-independent phosphoglycerate mutase [Candidatus Altiarchaeales archaeon]